MPATCHSLTSRYSWIASAARKERLRPVLLASRSSRFLAAASTRTVKVAERMNSILSACLCTMWHWRWHSQSGYGGVVRLGTTFTDRRRPEWKLRPTGRALGPPGKTKVAGLGPSFPVKIPIRSGRIVLVFNPDLLGHRWGRPMYKKVLLAYDGSIEGRRALREGAKLAQLCRAEVFLLAVVEVSSIMTPEAGLSIPIELQTEDYKAILAEGAERLKALGFAPTTRLEVGDAGQKIVEVAEEIGAHLVVVGHRAQGALARWFGSVGSYLVKRLRCSVLVGQTEIGDDEFERLKPPAERAASG